MGHTELGMFGKAIASAVGHIAVVDPLHIVESDN